jgi:hypothetical protein
MGFRFSSFIAGAAENLTETLKEDEKQAAAAASFGVKALKEQYDKVQADNRKLADDLSKKVKFLEQSDPTATQAQLFAAATNDVYMSAIMEAAKNNPGSFRVADVVKIKEGNASQGTALDMIKAYTTIPAISQAARQAEGGAVPEKPQGLFGIGTLRNRAAASAASRAKEQTAKAMGVSIEQLRAASGYKRPDIKTGAEFDFTSLQKQPTNIKEIRDKLQVQAYQAGKGSPEYLDIQKKLEGLEEFDKKSDASTEARAQRLQLELLDLKGNNPTRAAEIKRQLAETQASIRNHSESTKTKDPNELKLTYEKMKVRANDYVNSRLREMEGAEWRKYVDFASFKNDVTGETTISKVRKEGMSVAQQREMFAQERKLMGQYLRDFGYVAPDGTARTVVATELMGTFNISPSDLATPETKPEQQVQNPLPMANAAPTTPAPAQPAAPATRPVPQLTREDQDALVWANNPANAGPKADAIKKKIQNKINGAN